MSLVALGAGCPGEAAGCSTGYNGKAEASCCCYAWDTWSNLTHQQYKGFLSFYYWAERRVRHGLTFLTAAELDWLAHDRNAVLPDYLVRAGAEATQNWNELFRQDRWNKTGRGADTDCTSVGYYRAWVPDGPSDLTAVQLVVNRLTGKVQAEARKAWCGYPEWTWPPTTDSPSMRIWLLIPQAPGNEPQQNIKYLAPRSSYVVVKDGVVVPTDWTKAFLEVMAPVAMGQSKKSLSTSGVRMSAQKMLAPAAIKKLQASVAAVRHSAAVQADSYGDDDEEMSHSKATRTPEPLSPVVPVIVVAASGAFLAYAGWRVYKKRALRSR